MKNTHKAIATITPVIFSLVSLTGESDAATTYFDITEETSMGSSVITYKIHGDELSTAGLTFAAGGSDTGGYTFSQSSSTQGIVRGGSTSAYFDEPSEITYNYADLFLGSTSSIDLSSTTGDALPTIQINTGFVRIDELMNTFLPIGATSFSFTALSTDNLDFSGAGIRDGVTSSATWESNGEIQQIIIRTGSAVPEPSSALLLGLASFSFISKMKHNKNAEQVAVANPMGAFSVKFSYNYNLNTFVYHRSLP